MPQIIIKRRSVAPGPTSTEQEDQVLVIIQTDQVEIYTGDEAKDKLAED